MSRNSRWIQEVKISEVQPDITKQKKMGEIMSCHTVSAKKMKIWLIWHSTEVVRHSEYEQWLVDAFKSNRSQAIKKNHWLSGFSPETSWNDPLWPCRSWQRSMAGSWPDSSRTRCEAPAGQVLDQLRSAKLMLTAETKSWSATIQWWNTEWNVRVTINNSKFHSWSPVIFVPDPLWELGARRVLSTTRGGPGKMSTVTEASNMIHRFVDVTWM